MDWVIKNDYIGSAFFDASASAFIMPSLLLRANTSDIGSGDADSTLSGREQSSPTRVADVGNKGNRIGGDLHVQHLHQQQRNAIEESLHIDIARKEMHKSVVAGYGMGPEWIAKSCMQSFLKQQQDHKKRNDITGKLEVIML